MLYSGCSDNRGPNAIYNLCNFRSELCVPDILAVIAVKHQYGWIYFYLSTFVEMPLPSPYIEAVTQFLFHSFISYQFINVVLPPPTKQLFLAFKTRR